MIRATGLRVEAGGFGVGPLDLAIADGEYGVLLGPSGAGKTLALEALAGVRRLAAGSVEVGGEDVSARPPERRRVGLVFQDGLLFPHLSVAANIGYALRGGVAAEGPAASRPSRRAEVARLAAEVGVTDLLERRPATLSGGERQRAALARALAARPRALLLDEPLSAVDAEAREGLQDVLRRVCREQGLAVLHVTHDRAEAFALADVCAVMIDGRIGQLGRPLDVLRRPAAEAVARFLGARNLLRATRDPRDPRVARLAQGGELRCAEPLPAVEVRLVIRPEDVRLTPTGFSAGTAGGSTGPDVCPGSKVPAAPANVLGGVVTALTLQGGHVLVRVETPTALEALVPAAAVDGGSLTLGRPVDVVVDPADVHPLPAG